MPISKALFLPAVPIFQVYAAALVGNEFMKLHWGNLGGTINYELWKVIFGVSTDKSPTRVYRVS